MASELARKAGLAVSSEERRKAIRADYRRRALRALPALGLIDRAAGLRRRSSVNQ
jgi:hypothetical protein